MEILLWIMVFSAAVIAGGALWWLLTGHAEPPDGATPEQRPKMHEAESRGGAADAMRWLFSAGRGALRKDHRGSSSGER